MSESNPATGVRPVGAPAFDPVVRLGTPTPGTGTVTGGGRPSPSHPVLFPEPDADDETPRPAPKPRGYRSLARVASYLTAGLGGAVLVFAVLGLLGPRVDSSRNRAGSDSGRDGASPGSDMAVLDRRADTVAFAVSAFLVRARMYDTRQMGCTSLARGLRQVEDGWLAYNMARQETNASADSARDARDRGLYADVRAVELRFERSSCARP